MTLFVRLMAVASPNNPIAPGTILVTDSVSARTMPNYFQIALTGTTNQRPIPGTPGVVSLKADSQYFDTTLNKLIIFDGAQWRDPTSGAVV